VRRGLVLVIAVTIAGCGGILSAFGEDPSPDPGPGADADASSDATTADGGSNIGPSTDAPIVGDVIVIDTGTDAKGDAGPSLRVFVTSTTYAGDALGFPDTVCGSAAAGLGGTWRAWISHPLRQAANVVTGNGPWRTLQGTLIAQDKAQLLSGKLAGTINVDEKGNPRDAFVWTGTSASGSGLSHCAQWSETSGVQGTYGQSAVSAEGWTNAGTVTCTNDFAIYCFEIPGP
jgi:hypothetical protein